MRGLMSGLVLVCLLALSQSAKAYEQPADAKVIIANVHAMWKAVETNNLNDYMQHIHPDYTLFGEGDAYLKQGKAMEREDIGEYLTRAKNVKTFMHQPKVVVRGNTAWLTYYWSDSGYINGERFTSRGKSTRIFVKENGRWLCIHSHFTSLA